MTYKPNSSASYSPAAGRAGTRLAVLALVLVAFTACRNKPPSEVSNKPSQDRTTNKVSKETTMAPTKVILQTTMGDIVIELNKEKAPVTVKNFLGYVEEGFYNGTIFHRIIPGFMIQGGGSTADMTQKDTHPPITNEAANGLANNKGTIAMARKPDPDSATSQFFINHKDNDFLNYTGPANAGYAVFGKVSEGMDVVDKIAAVRTGRKGRHSDVPIEPVVIKSAKIAPDK